MTASDCSALLDALKGEERALESLLFKLREQHLVLTSGEHRWLAATTGEVAAAVEALTGAGSVREAAAAAAHARHGLPAGASIAALAGAVDDELTCQLLHQQQRRLRDLLDQVRRTSRQNRELLAQGLAATNDALALLGVVPTYDSSGEMSPSGGDGPIRTFDARV